jgi:hypothetical protein
MLQTCKVMQVFVPVNINAVALKADKMAEIKIPPVRRDSIP